MLKRFLTILCVIILLCGNASFVSAKSDNDNDAFTKLRTVDVGTFNEYKYRLTEEFFNLRNDYEVTGIVKNDTIVSMYRIAKESYNYLPDNLINKNLFKKLEIALAKTVKFPANESMYLGLIDALDKYLDDVNIKSVKGTIKATPKEGNAPLSVSLRGNVRDETGTKIPGYNYIWFIDEAGTRKVIGNKPSINYVFREEGTFSVFLDVISSHKNSKGFTDVLPFRSRADITIKEKIASLIIKVNSDNLRNKDELKFTPEEAAFGLIFDATSSTPTDGAKFTRTEWDFGNGIKRINTGEPQIERIKYTKEGEFSVKLILRTNENKKVERRFSINVHDPIATISVSKDEGFLGDKFTFSAKPTGSDDDLSYYWEIIDIDFDKQIFTKSGKTFTYVFPRKGKYNVKLRVTEPSGEVDIDTKIIYINSRAPVADFNDKVKDKHKPNTILLDGSKSYDLDGVDDGKLKFEWIIDGDRVELDALNFTGGIGYYTFNSIGDHSVLLRVTDPEGISAQITKKVNVQSILSLDFDAYPRVTQRESSIRFVGSSPEAKVFAWDFGDGSSFSGRESQSSHKYKQAGIYKVKLLVTDSDDNTNTYSKNVYIGESNAPLANIKITGAGKKDVAYEKGVCFGAGAYILDRAGSVTFDARDSIDVTGKKGGISYSWKLGFNKYFSTANFTQKFDELGCSKIQLTVKSESKGTTNRISYWVKVKNLKPTLSSVDVQVVDGDADPVIVKISALGAKDPDGVIQSYLWYYYTDIDPEPQDFRATKLSNTTFVLPKVTGNYYFVVLMKDNNEARISSEEITGSKYFITLTGDNINVPLVTLSVNDSSISVGQEVTFTVEVENILGYNLSNKAQYSWDLDGDGFYEQKTNAPSISYTYDRSGEFYAKVKAKYKGYSNTKSITMNVANLLKPHVEYISIGNKFAFFDASIGKSDSVTWDLGDGTVVKDTKNFIHIYSGNKGSYDVSLNLKEGIKSATENFNVSRNMRNILQARKKGIILFSNKDIKDNSITLEKSKEKVFIYLGESKSDNETEITDFTIDLDTNYDSNLNGGKDDDRDISFAVGQNDNIVQIKLNENKDQNIVITAYDIDGEVMYTKELLITKTYIEDSEIDINSIIFNGITDSERLTIEKLKSEIKRLPKEYRLKSLMYIQKLQEEWFDAGERIKVIVEFEGYISSVDMPNADIIFDLLKELVLMNEDDKSEKNLIFVALKSLTPTNIECELSTDIKDATCYDAIIERLNIIKVNTDIDQNKVLGKEILLAIETYPDMKINEKNNYKAILSSFIYGGVENIPEKEKTDEMKRPNDKSDGDDGVGSKFLGVLGTILWIFSIIIGIFLGIFLLFFIWYKVGNKNDNIGFQDFIIEKTSGRKYPIITKKDDTEDVLSELDKELSEDEEIQVIPQTKDKLDDSTPNQVTNIGQENKVKEKIETNKQDVPDWLKGNFSDDSTDKKSDKKSTEPLDSQGDTLGDKKSEKTEELNKNSFQKQGDKNKFNKFGSENKNRNKNKFSKKSDFSGKNKEEKAPASDEKNNDMPDWLKGVEESTNVKNTNQGSQEKANQKSATPEKTNEVNEKKSQINTKEELDDITKIEKDSDIPDWLKGSLDETVKKEEKTETEKNNIDDKKDLTLQDKQEKTSIVSDDSNIPDWLKGSFDETVKKEETEVKTIKKEVKSEEKEVKNEKTENTAEKSEVKTEEVSEEKKIEKPSNVGKLDTVDQSKVISEKKISTKTTEKTDIIPQDKEKSIVKKTQVTEEKIVKVTEKNMSTTNNKERIKNNDSKNNDSKNVAPPKKTVDKQKPETVEKKAPEKKNTQKEEVTEKKEIVTEKKAVKKSNKVEPQSKDGAKDSEKTDAESLVIEAVKKEQTSKKTAEKKDGTKKIEDELWDDGMKIPDWLQSDENKK